MAIIIVKGGGDGGRRGVARKERRGGEKGKQEGGETRKVGRREGRGRKEGRKEEKKAGERTGREEKSRGEERRGEGGTEMRCSTVDNNLKHYINIYARDIMTRFEQSRRDNTKKKTNKFLRKGVFNVFHMKYDTEHIIYNT